MEDKKFEEFLYRYVDGELTEKEAQEFKRYLSSHPVAAYELEKAQKFDALLKNHMVKEEAPYALRESIMEALNKPSWPDRLRQLGWTRGLSMATVTSVLIIATTAWIFSSINKPFPVFAASIDNHIDYLKGSYPLEIVTDDMEVALNWFKGKLDFSVSRPHVNLGKARLVGARIIHVKDRKAAFFIFEKEGQHISAVVVDLKGKNLPRKDIIKAHESNKATVFVANDRGYQCALCFHKLDKTACLIITDASDEEIMRLLG